VAIRALSSNLNPGSPVIVTVPAETRRGDVMVWWSMTDNGSSFAGTNSPVEFRTINPAIFGTTVDGCGLRLAVRIATGAEPASYQVTGSNQVAGIVVLVGVRFAGLKSSARAVDSQLLSPWNLSGTGLMLREVSDVLWFGASDTTSSLGVVTNTAPPGYAMVAQYHSFFYHLAIAAKPNVLPGQTGSLIGTGTNAGRSAGSVVRALAFPRTAGNTRRSQLLATWPLPRYSSASINITARKLLG
jgi:hypothetical protein